MRSWNISRKLLGGFASTLLLVAVASGVALWSASSIRAGGERTVTDAEALRLVTSLQAVNTMIFAAEKNMIIGGMVGDSKGLEVWTDKLQASIADGEKIAARIKADSPTPDERRIAQDLEAGMQAWNGRCDSCHAVADELKTHPEKVLKLSNESEALMQANVALANRLQQSRTRALETRRAESARTFGQAWLAILLTVVASIGVAIGIFLLVRGITRAMREAAQQLRAGADQVLMTAGQVSDSAQSLSKGATDQAASLQETSASMEEMASMTRKNAENSRSAASFMAAVDKRVNESNAALAEMVSSMQMIQRSSDKVSKIIRTIDDIAFQTNILALNAAVEAARAGDAGLGFAVVADEVRNLAQRSAGAAKDTSALIEESLQNARSGSAKVEQVATAITAITESVANVRGLVEEVSVASSQQAQGIDQTSEAILRLEQVTQTTAASAEQSAAASEELKAQAESTMDIVRQLQALVGVARTAAADDAVPVPVAATASLSPVVSLSDRRSQRNQQPQDRTGTFGAF